MTKAQERWKELGDQLESLGLKLKLHVMEETSELEDDVEAGLARFARAVEDVFAALGDVVDDEAVRADAKEAGRRLVDAVDATWTEVGGVIRDRTRRG